MDIYIVRFWAFKENKVLKIVIKNTDKLLVSQAFTPRLLQNKSIHRFWKNPLSVTK